MEYKYLITDIQEKTKVSITSLTTFKNKHKDFFNNNSTRKHRKIYYNQAAMDFFTNYYCHKQTAEEGEKIVTAEKQKFSNPTEAENSPFEDSSSDKPHESQISAMKDEIDALQAEIDSLRRQLEAKEAERLELLRQNGALILTLQQAQQEKMLLLPAPKKTFSDKLKSIFKGKPQEK